MLRAIGAHAPAGARNFPDRENKQTDKKKRAHGNRPDKAGSRVVREPLNFFIYIFLFIYLFIFVVVCCALVFKHLIDPQSVDCVTEGQTSDQNGKMARSYLRVERLSPHFHAVMYVVSPRDRVSVCPIFHSILFDQMGKTLELTVYRMYSYCRTMCCAAIQKRERETIHIVYIYMSMHRSSSTCRVSHNRERREEKLPTVKGFHFNFVSSIHPPFHSIHPSIHLLYVHLIM